MKTTHHSPLTTHASSRGVVLIVVLGMLAVLALIGVAFLTFSAEEEQSSSRFQAGFQTPRADMAPDLLFLEALSQLIADTENPQSAIRGHSLLRRMYGNDNDANGNGRIDIAEYNFRAFNGPGDLGDTSVSPVVPVDFNFVYNNRLPEYVWDSAAMMWVKGGGFDVDYTYPDHQNLYLAAIRADGTVLAPSFHRDGYLNVDATSVSAMNPNDWSSLANPLGAGRGRRIILRPRPVDHGTRTGFDTQPGVAGFDDDGDGIVDNDSELGWPGSDDIGFGRTDRPDSLRPYDVDNMGLGRPDSVWVDIAFPVYQTANGKKFKPLVAFLVMDLDGKLNLNIHGNLTYDKLNAAGALVFPGALGDGAADSHADIAPGMVHGGGAVIPYPVDLPFGSAWSVNEVNLQNPFNRLFTGLVPATIDAREYKWLLEGRPAGQGTSPPSQTIPGRWGEVPNVGGVRPRAGATFDTSLPPAIALRNADDTTPGYFTPRGNRNEGRPNTAGGVYGTPPDFDGNGVLATDADGIPRLGPPNHGSLGWGGQFIGWPPAYGHTSQRENVDDASELNPYVSQSNESLFTPFETELLYRAEDVDAYSLLHWLPGNRSGARLGMLAPSLFDFTNALNRKRRLMLTTESWDLIRPNHFPLLSWESKSAIATMPQAGNGIFPFMDSTNPAYAAFIATLPESIRSGRRMPITPQFPPITPLINPIPEKYAFVKALYVMMWSSSLQAGPSPPPFARAKRIAQFCVNALEFTDTEAGLDEVNTPFVFDINPFSNIGVVAGLPEPNGWDVVSDATDVTTGAAERGVVWGTEAPAVLVNETFAYEDASGNFVMWVELINPGPKAVDLLGTNQSYQLVIGDQTPRLAPDPAEGEPSAVLALLNFSAASGSGSTLIPPGERLIVGPAGPLPPELGGGPFGNPLTLRRFVPSATFAPPGVGDFRLYVRKLANPYQPEAGTATFPNSANPYITVDALDVHCYSNLEIVPDPLNGNQVVARSIERRSLSVAKLPHAAGGPAPLPPPHSIGDESPADDLTPFNSLPAVDVNGDGAVDPWPWLVFNDRPFATPTELLLVPATSPQHLTTAFAYPLSGVGSLNPYNPLVGQINTNPLITGKPAYVAGQPFLEPVSEEYLFGHLLNFFREVPGSAVPRPGYYRIFEYVEVPSRINGSHDPNIQMVMGDIAGRGRNDRVPGRININTVYEQEVFQAALNNHPLAMDATAAAWLASQIPTYGAGAVPIPERATSASTGKPYASLSSDLYRRVLLSIANPLSAGNPGGETIPRLFNVNDRPFRSFSVGTAPAAYLPNPLKPALPSIHSTFLRGLEDGPFPLAPVFEDDRGPKRGGLPYPPPGLTGGVSDLADYPYFRWQIMQRMSNVFTTRSNVFAVWMTVGFFEVLDENPLRLGPGINAPPQLGAEINADVGQNVRHRAFFIIDRSRARGYLGPPRSSEELQDILSQVVIHSRIME